MKELTWEELYKIANNLINPRKISPYIDAGKAACVIITSKGNMYTGINLETKCDLGICAERNAILNMIKNQVQ